MDDLLKGCSASQREAIMTTEGFVRVVAGAGSGKTGALSKRFAFLVNEAGILPGGILCVTFTNKAAGEMRQRIRALTGDSDTGFINTFHGFCVSVLQEESHAVRYPSSFLVLDNSDIDSMLRAIYEERGLTLRDMTFAEARDMIEMQKLFSRPDYYLDMIDDSPEALRGKYLAATGAKDIIFFGYLWQEKKTFALDYNDLIKFTLYIFEQNEEIRLKWQKRLEYIMIDEFQDIDDIQYRLMEALCGFHKNLFIVGDPDQTIYTWRGANVKYLLDFDRKFPDVKTVMMMENYRSTPQILACANALVSKNRHRMKKDLIPTLPDGAPVVGYHGETAAAESEWIAKKIEALHAQGTPYRDIAVLYRAHYVTRNVEEAFLKEKIPYVIYSGVQFFDRMEIKDALSYLRLVVARDDLSFLRVANVPKRNLGRRRMEALRAYADANGCTLYEALCRNLEDPLFKGTGGAKLVDLIERFGRSYPGRPVSEVLSDLLIASGYEKMLRTEGSGERLDNLAELKQSVYDFEISCGEECTAEHYLAHAALFTNADTGEKGDRVKLMTVHAAKGLEFPTVFLCGMNEGVFPSRKISTLEGMEEERRLAFVAVTRARERLFLSEAEGFNFDGSNRWPSRFLFDMGDALTEWERKPKDSVLEGLKRYAEKSESALRQDAERTLLSPGQRVKHAHFGTGTILEADEKRGAYLVRFDGMETARSIAFRIPMEPLG